MNPPVLALLGASGTVTDIIGAAPVRCFAFGFVPAPPDAVSIKVSASTGGISSPVTLQFKEAL